MLDFATKNLADGRLFAEKPIGLLGYYVYNCDRE